LTLTLEVSGPAQTRAAFPLVVSLMGHA